MHADAAAERQRRIGALNTAFGLHCDPHAGQAELEQQCRAQLQQLLLEGDVVDIGALFDFVDATLPKLDRALSGGVVSDAPNLMILIDQFEEVFKPKVNAAGRDMVMSLITSVHAYKPFNLFVIVTMRSEELHRCAEFLGLAEVVNKSLYLVDLIGGKDIENAIVGPVRRLLKSWELDPGSPDTGPYTRRALSRLHVIFDDGRELLPHPADQLPLMQHMLPLVWERAVERWLAANDDKPLEIDIRDLELLPGWTAKEGALIGTLNARADNVLGKAVRAGAERSGLDRNVVEQLLRAAFCCLAQLDDRGNVVRDFATIEQMLEASGVFEREVQQQSRCRSALDAALKVFQNATLVNIARACDVNHEALIRSWHKYIGWLRDAQRHAARLASVDRQIQDAAEPAGRKQIGPLRAFDRVVEWISARRLARADQIAGDETSADLQDVVGRNRTFSDQWAGKVLERADSLSIGAQVARPVLVERLEAVRATIDDAIDYRAGAKNRPRNLLAILVVLFAGGGIIAYWLLSKSAEQEQLASQFRFFRLQSEATAQPLGSTEKARDPADDRELYAALDMGAELAQKTPTEEARVVLRNSIRSLERGARIALSDVAVRIVPAGSGGFTPAESDCAVVNADDPRVLMSRHNLGIRLRRDELDGRVATVAMEAVWRAVDGAVTAIELSDLNGQSLPPGSLVCLSNDANWFLMWTPLAQNQSASPPYLQRIVWIRTAPGQATQDGRWRADPQPHRRPSTRPSYTYLEEVNHEFADLRSRVQRGERPVKSFSDGDRDRAGFMFAVGSDKLAVLWSGTGILEPDPVTRDGPQLVGCNFAQVAKDALQRPVMFCDLGPVQFEGQTHRVQALYLEDALAPGGCAQRSAPCNMELRVVFDPPDRVGPSLRTSISHLASTITAAAIDDGYLWLADANGQRWRYAIGAQRLRSLLKYRWVGVAEDELRKSPYTDACLQAKPCATKPIDGWPQGDGLR